MKQTLKWILGGLLGLAAATAGGVAAQRMGWEGAYRQVSLALSGTTLSALVEEGVPPVELEARFPYVVVDAAGLAAFAPLKLAPWPGLSPTEAPLSEARLEAWRDAGWAPVVVLSPLLVLDPPRLAALRAALAAVHPEGVLVVDGPLRWPARVLQQVAAVLAEGGRWLGTVEFYEPRGLLELYRAGHTDWVWAHLIPARERAELSRAEVLDRWTRAVRERSLRLLLFDPAGDPRSASGEAEALAERLDRAGFAPGPVRPPPPWRLPVWTMWLLALGPWSATLWLFERLWRRPWAFLSLALSATGVAVGALGAGAAGREFLALSTAIVWPMALYRGLTLWSDRRGWGFALVALIGGFAATVLGGLVEAAFLSGPAYFLKLGEFHGVKLAFVEPLVVIVLWELRRRGPGIWKQLWQRPLTWGEAALGLGLLGALVGLLARTGNDSFLPLLPGESQLRGALEAWLVARPRFKEFFIGYPLLVLWLGRGPRRWGLGGVAVLAGAFLAPATLLNSFAHLHTPLTFTLLRSANGLLLGSLVGTGLWAVWRWSARRWARA